MQYKLKKITNPASVYPPPAYKVTDEAGEEIGTLYKVKGIWRFEAAQFEFTTYARTIKLCMQHYQVHVKGKENG